MTRYELNAMVAERMQQQTLLGCIAANLRSNDTTIEQHRDGHSLQLEWQERGDGWRCTISTASSASAAMTSESSDLTGRIAHIDLYDNATVRIESFEPCRIIVSQDEGFILLTRAGV